MTGGPRSTSIRRRESSSCDDCRPHPSYCLHSLRMYLNCGYRHCQIVAGTHVCSRDFFRRYGLYQSACGFSLGFFSWFSYYNGRVCLDLLHRLGYFQIPMMSTKVRTAICGGRESWKAYHFLLVWQCVPSHESCAVLYTFNCWWRVQLLHP